MKVTATRVLAEFAATLDLNAVPDEVRRRTEDLFLDWFASALAGKGARPVEALARVVEAMIPASGPAEILIHPEEDSRSLTGLHACGKRRASA